MKKTGARDQGPGISKPPKLTKAGRERMRQIYQEDDYDGDILAILATLNVGITAIEEIFTQLESLKRSRAKELTGHFSLL